MIKNDLQFLYKQLVFIWVRPCDRLLYFFGGNWISTTMLSFLTELTEHKGRIKSFLISFILILFDDSSLQRNDK